MTTPMHFDKFGRTFQLRVRSGDELEQVLELDDSLWIAMSAPVEGLNTDREFLDYVDLDDNGRIRTDEIRAAIRWLLERLSDRSGLADGAAELVLVALNPQHPDACDLCETAEYILAAIDAEDRSRISLRELDEFTSAVDASVINGDGVIPPVAAEEPDLREFIHDVVNCLGGETDLTGRAGVTEDLLDQFMNEATAYLEWLREGDIPDGQGTTTVMPLGQQTPAAHAALSAVRGKLDEFFARCRFVRFRPEAAERVGVDSAPAPGGAGSIEDALRVAPLTEPNPEGVVPLGADLNPAWARAVQRFRDVVVGPVLGEVEQLSEPEWEELKATFAPHESWLSRKPPDRVSALGRGKLAKYVAPEYGHQVRELTDIDRGVAGRLRAVERLRTLLLYHRYLLPLVNNFVSFPDLYSPHRRALFEMGSLVIDGRWFNFAVRVRDVKAHKEVALNSLMYVLYLHLWRAEQTEEITVAAPATSGTTGNLCVGKRGIFIDTEGRQYDAQVVDIIDNPISFREALAAPFVRLARFIGGKIEAISGTAQKELEAQVGRMTQKVQTGAQETIRQAPQVIQQAERPAEAAQRGVAEPAKSRRDLWLGASVSVAALSSAFAFVTNQLSSAMEKPWHLGAALVLIVLVVLVPTAVVAAFKLARRDLSAILEGCGWAVNARMRLNRKQRHQFTRREPYPPQATGTPRKRWLLLALSLILLALCAGLAVRYLLG